MFLPARNDQTGRTPRSLNRMPKGKRARTIRSQSLSEFPMCYDRRCANCLKSSGAGTVTPPRKRIHTATANEKQKKKAESVFSFAQILQRPKCDSRNSLVLDESPVSGHETTSVTNLQRSCGARASPLPQSPYQRHA